MRTLQTALDIRHLLALGACSSVLLCAALPAHGAVVTNPTMDTGLLANGLHPAGLTIKSLKVSSGVAGQFGTYSNFVIPPVTIQNGIVLSSGDVTNLGPIPGATDPGYDPSSPPAQVNSQMTPEPDSGGTPEFDLYGATAGSIENFYGSFDVASITVTFTLSTATQIKFDFIFGSVEYPFWTGLYTDAFLVFLDGLDPSNQICYDPSGNAVQVGSSFAGLETTADQNTAFSNPHGLLHHLTTTTAELSEGEHVLVFEVGDVNDHILDSAVFIANLRAEAGTEGTEPTEDLPCAADLDENGIVDGADLGILLGAWGDKRTAEDLDGNGVVDGGDIGLLLAAWGPC
ncbi:MAG: choice-of-anchor L domain-containing protein [Phycisphaerales bacterium]